MPISPINKPRVYMTMGDPAGIGPEIIAKTLASPEIQGLASFTVIGDEGVFEKVSPHLSPDVDILDPGPPLGDVTPGKPSAAGAKKALGCISLAAKTVIESADDIPRAIVTAPVSKEEIANIHPGFVGHTEHLQQAFSAPLVTMVMVGDKFSVIPVTRHIPIREVASKLSTDIILKTLRQVVDGRRLISGKDDPRITVTALNPHAGEGGKIGKEEAEVIAPAVSEAKEFYPNIEGPLPADTVFYAAFKGKTDIVVSMYHDQCLAPFKMVHFDDGINMTLGLGCVRTSPDHGTAFDIAGKGIASPTSMENAVKLAVRAISR